MALTSALYLVPSLLHAMGYSGALLSGALKFLLVWFCQLWLPSMLWNHMDPGLRAAQVMSSIAVYSIVLTLPYRSMEV